MHLYLRSHTVEMNIGFAIMVLENKRGLHKCTAIHSNTFIRLTGRKQK